MNVLDLFSGIGGFSLGLERAGMKTVAFCEMDPGCQAVLRKHWPEVPIFEDVKRLKYRDGNFNLSCLNDSNGRKGLATSVKIDVICGGFPCQDISIAGNKKGLSDESEILSDLERDFTGLFKPDRRFRDATGDDFLKLCGKVKRTAENRKPKETRSGLWKEFKRLIQEIGPRYAIIENVANLRTQGLARIIKDLGAIGYDCTWHVIPAASIGAHHLRERIWIIATSSDSNYIRQREIFASQESAQRWWSKAASSLGAMWSTERYENQSRVCRISDGISTRMESHRSERIKQLGNAVVPQIPELIGRALMMESKDEKL